ncbi:hypothetical protein HDV00_005100 [Rhizophlyctis rosea]|nr:hypothetical protein HDV00_005100 [Rhizophlyctis rosea]
MQFKSLLSLLAVVGLASAQQSSSYQDSQTGLTFQQYTDSTSGVSVGIALPSGSSNELVIQLKAPSTGWTGISLGGGMTNNLLVLAWANGNSIVTSSRYTTAYSAPTVYTGPTLTLLKDSTVSGGNLRATIRCQNCRSWKASDGSTYNFPTSGFQLLGYAHSTTAPTTPSDSSSAISFHQTYGEFGVSDVSSAQNSNYVWVTRQSGTFRQLH